MIDVQSMIKAKFTSVNQVTEPEKWSELRTTGIGGSDAGAILGMNKYASRLSVYMAKKGITNFEGNAATKWGHILEDPIRQESMQELGITLVTVPGMYTSNEYPFMNANVDGLAYAEHQVRIKGREIEGLGIHEIKTSANGDGFGEDEIPDSYYCQVQHYMCVTGLKWAILSAFILSSRELKHYVVVRNDDFIENRLIPEEKDFWENYVEKNVIPSPEGSDNENEVVKSLPMADNVQLDDSILDVIRKEREINSQIKELSKKQAALKNEILLAIYKASEDAESSEKTVATVGDYKITYNLQIRKSVNSDALKKAGLYDEYTKENSYKELRIREVKK